MVNKVLERLEKDNILEIELPEQTLRALLRISLDKTIDISYQVQKALDLYSTLIEHNLIEIDDINGSVGEIMIRRTKDLVDIGKPNEIKTGISKMASAFYGLGFHRGTYLAREKYELRNEQLRRIADKVKPQIYGNTFLEALIENTSIFMGVAKELIFGGITTGNYYKSRKFVIWSLRNLGFTYKTIAEMFGCNHATIIHHNKSFYDYLESDKDYRYRIQGIFLSLIEDGYHIPPFMYHFIFGIIEPKKAKMDAIETLVNDTSEKCTPNGLYVLWCIANNRKPNAIRLNLSLEYRLLKHFGYINPDLSITPNGLSLLGKYKNQGRNIEHLEKNITDMDYIEQYVSIFPKVKLPSNQYARVNPKNLESSFRWFFKTFPQYTWDTVIKATHRYVEEYEANNYKFMKTSQYFIVKHNNKVANSELANYCMKILSGDQDEDNTNHFKENVV